MHCSHRILTAGSLSIMVSLMLISCASQETNTAQDNKDKWLEQSFTAATPAQASKKQSDLIRLPDSPRFRNAILSGQVQRGMSLDETQATLRAKPYGTRDRSTVYWCEQQPVSECTSQCVKCEAYVFGDHHVVMLEGFGRQVTVTDFYPQGFANFRATVDPSARRFAQSLYERKIVPGMSAGLVQMLVNLQGYTAEYFCDAAAQGSSESCLGRCNECRVEITPRSDAEKQLIIRLETHAGQQSVSEILQR